MQGKTGGKLVEYGEDSSVSERDVEDQTIKAKTLAEMGDDWTPFGVSLVDNPAVPKARFLVVKSQNEEGRSMAKSSLHDRRTKLRLTQDQLAEKSGVPRGRISEFETGRRMLTLEQARKLQPVLKMSAGSLVSRHIRDLAVATKSTEGGKGKIHRALGDLEDLADSVESDEEEAAIRDAIKELKAVVGSGDDKPEGETVEKGRQSSRKRNQGRDSSGRRRRVRNDQGGLESATKETQDRGRNPVNGKRRRPRQY